MFADQIKHQSSASLASLRGIHRWPVNSPHKWPVTRKMFPFDAVIMIAEIDESLIYVQSMVYLDGHYSVHYAWIVCLLKRPHYENLFASGLTVLQMRMNQVTGILTKQNSLLSTLMYRLRNYPSMILRLLDMNGLSHSFTSANRLCLWWKSVMLWLSHLVSPKNMSLASLYFSSLPINFLT